MKRFLIAFGLIVGCAAAQAADPVTEQDMLDTDSYIDQCRQVIKDPHSDNYEWCESFLIAVWVCENEHARNPLKEYSNQQNRQYAVKVIQCLRSLIEL